MPDPATLSIFAGAVLLLMLSPGPNMAFVVAHGAAFGFGGGFAASLGIAAADLVLTALTATGITALVAAWAPAFDVVRYAGAAYLLWLAAKALRPSRGPGAAVAMQASLPAVFVRGMLNCLLNPKALLFFMVFLPQFAEPGRGPVAPQLLVLGCVLTAISLAYHGALGVLGGTARRLLAARPRMARLQSGGLAAVLLLLALRLVLMQRPA